LATDEAETICALEKRNFELVDLQKKMENNMEVEREKLKRALDNGKKEGELLKILVNELHREIEGKDDQIKEIATQLAEAKDDVLKLEEANSRLKGQAISKWVDAAEATLIRCFQEEFALLRGSREMSRSRHSEMSRYSEMSRQSSERQTEASTPFPQDAANQESSEREEKLSCACVCSSSTLTPSLTEANPQHKMRTVLPKVQSWHLMSLAFIIILPAMIYRLFFR